VTRIKKVKNVFYIYDLGIVICFPIIVNRKVRENLPGAGRVGGSKSKHTKTF